MKRLPLALTIACASILAHAQSFPYTENWPSGINAAIWNVVSGPAREVLYKNAGNVTDYSVQTQVHCDGTDYAHFLRATLVTTIYGSTYWGAYSVVYNASTQTDDYGNDYCTGSVGIYRNGAVLASTGVSGDSVPLVSQIVGNQITVIVNGVSILSTTDTTYNAGPPGVGWDPSTPTATTTLTALNYGAPPAPTSLAGAAPNYATVNLSWTAPSYFETPSYNVYRNGEFLANVWTTSFQDHDQGTWSYTVKAMNGGGIESAS